MRFGGALLGSGGAWRKLSFLGLWLLVGVIGTLLLLGFGSPCGADPPYSVSGPILFEAVAVAPVGGVAAMGGLAVGAVVEDDEGPGCTSAAGAVVEDDAGPGCTSGAGVAIVAVVAAGF